MGKRDENFGFSINNPYEDDAPKRRAYDQDSDNGIGSNYNRAERRSKSEDSDLYKEYMRQYQENSDARDGYDDEYEDEEFEYEDSYEDEYEEEEESIELSSYSEKSKKTKKKKRRKKAIIITVTAVVVVLAILLTLLWPYLNYNRKKITKKPKDLGFTDIINKKVVNIALFGLDTRDKNSFEGRSDSIMILSINTETKKVKVISIMRDTIVNIEHKGESFFSKINSAYDYGGPELAIKTINKTYGLDISNYATINFFGMVDIIDAVGGIEADITEDELDFKGDDCPNLNGCMIEICDAKGLNPEDYYIHSAGHHQLNGVQAVAYSRIRYCLSTFGTIDDYGRTDRQRHVMEQLFSKAINLPKTKYAKLAKALLPCSETSLGIDDILSLAFEVLLKSPQFVQCRVPQMEWIMPFNYSGYGSCVYYDLDYATRVIHAIIYDDMTIEQFTEANPVEKNDWFAKYGTKNSDADWSDNTQNYDNNVTDNTQNTPTDNTQSNTEQQETQTTEQQVGSEQSGEQSEQQGNTEQQGDGQSEGTGV